jgi:hypothetical protein
MRMKTSHNNPNLGVLYPEVIDCSAKREWARSMVEEAGSVFGLLVAVREEVFDEALVRDDAGLWEAVHPLADFYEDVSIVD